MLLIIFVARLHEDKETKKARNISKVYKQKKTNKKKKKKEKKRIQSKRAIVWRQCTAWAVFSPTIGHSVDSVQITVLSGPKIGPKKVYSVSHGSKFCTELV